MMNMMMSDSDKNYLIDGCADDCRMDGRERDEMRRYTVVTSTTPSVHNNNNNSNTNGPLSFSNGSARLLLSSNSASTHLLCSVKVEVGTPSATTPHQGMVLIHVEDCLAAAAGSGSRKQAEQDRSTLESLLTQLLSEHVVDLHDLCIVPYQYAFTVHVDVEILAANAGSLPEACSHVIRAALQTTLFPNIVPFSSSSSTTTTPSTTGLSTSDLILDPDISQATFRAARRDHSVVMIVTITVCQRGDSFLLLLDASREEEACSSCQVHVTVMTYPNDNDTKDKEPLICALQKTGQGSLPWALLPDITTMAMNAVPKAMACYKIATTTTTTSSTSHSSQQHQPHILQPQLDIQ
jgi:exosome complex RNA-binding protein Rrp42 (RNase PH superfamily)